MTIARNIGSINKRWLLWLPLLGFAGWLSLSSTDTPSHTHAAAPLTTRSSQSQHDLPQSSSTSQLLTVVPRDVLMHARATGKHDLFAQRSWQRTEAPVAHSEPAAVAPPASPPFTYAGKKFEAGAWEIYLSRNDEVFVVKEGTVIEQTYRVESIDPPTLGITDLTTNQLHTILIGEAN